MHSWEPPAFDNDSPTPTYELPIETRLVKALRRWREDPAAITQDCNTLETEIALLLEWFICQCLEYDPDHLGAWWSDGVILLQICEKGQNQFKLLGVTWIGSLGIAPFEIDVELIPSVESHFAKTIFRIGMLDKFGQAEVLNHRVDAHRVLEIRPRQNKDWAMAVELTPPVDTPAPPP